MHPGTSGRCTAAGPPGTGPKALAAVAPRRGGRLRRRPRPAAALGLLAALALGPLACGPSEAPPPAGGPPVGWPSWGGDPGGLRHSPLREIHVGNVERLRPAWVYHTGDLPDARGDHPSTLASEVTPILVEGTLYLCTPYNRVIALDPETGEERWAFDPEIELGGRYANQLVCRGVSFWRDPEAPAERACARRIFTATNDARLIALDARTGVPCADFGVAGAVDLNPGVGRQAWRGEYQVTSPPALAGGLVVVGSAISDNQRTDAPSGVVRAFDARTGALRWAFDLAPPGFHRTPENTTEHGYLLGTPNVWAPMAVDAERDLLFVPTGNPAPDYFRGPSTIDHYGSSVVALRASTGEVVWRFQTVHHDLWDYDVPAQPTLFTLQRGGRSIPALAQGTKMGLVFVLHRETGEALFPVEERPVPAGGVPGEQLSPTQPFPVRPPPLVRHRLDPREAFGLTPWDRGVCRRRLEALRNDGIYTPPTLQGSLVVPGNAGGINWGGVAVDPERQLLITNVQDLPWTVRLVARDRIPADLDGYLAPMEGTPYRMHRELLLSPLGMPCSPPPWGKLVALDLRTGGIAWERPIGTLRELSPIPLPVTVGIPNLGGPLVTAGGVTFLAATLDRTFRAFDTETGAELWHWRLPAGGQATPMTYRAREGGRQVVLIAATGYGRAPGGVGDAIVAFTLDGAPPAPGDAEP